MTTFDVLFAGVSVTDLEASAGWYGKLFDRPADVLVNDDEVMWRVADGAWLYLIRDANRAGRSLATLCVADLDQCLAKFSERGVEVAPVESVGTAGRKAVILDPDGNTINVIEVTGSAA